MLKFISAKINLGLNIVGKRPDGYHLLQTIFVPVGRFNGTPSCPYPFCDILEIVPTSDGSDSFEIIGTPVDCPAEENIVWKALLLFRRNLPEGVSWPGFRVILSKHIPFGAGLGGGSADAVATLSLLDEFFGGILPPLLLAEMALSLGADCPFFLHNSPCLAEGVGEILHPVSLNLDGKWLLLCKPPFGIPTKEAFAGISPQENPTDLRLAAAQPMHKWNGLITNDFEAIVFPRHSMLRDLKEALSSAGALFASMSGSGSTIYGIFPSEDLTLRARDAVSGSFADLYTAVIRL